MSIKIRGRKFGAFNVVAALGVAAWLLFQWKVPGAAQNATINNAFMLLWGAWLSNLAIEQRRKDSHLEAEVRRLKGDNTPVEEDEEEVVSDKGTGT